MSLFEQGDFILHSGGRSRYRINCNRLTDEDLEMVAARMVEVLPPYGMVRGIPHGGLRMALAMMKHIDTSVIGATLLLVDDVWSTGASMEKERARLAAKHPMITIRGMVIFKRGQGELPPWVYSFADIDI